MCKRIILTISCILLALACNKIDPPAPVGPLPSESQLAWHVLEYYMFIHFTVNTFTNKEWGFGDESPDIFNPVSFDARQWAGIAKEAGMTGLILSAKHHDGFCLYPSEFTEHSVKNSPFMDGKGDIVADLRRACDEFGLKLGIYLSPWDRNHKDYGTEAYIDYYRKQLRELLGNYGEIFEVWFDGANGGTGYYGGANDNRKIDRETYYDWHNTWALVRELQPDAIMFSDAGPDIRWVGNESGMGSATNWCLLRRDEFYPGSPNYGHLGEGHEDGTHWVPAEVDVSIRPGWFYHPEEDDKVKSPEKLMEIYYSSVGRNGNLLLNVPPDRRGLIHENDIKALMEFKELREKEFEKELAHGKKVYASVERGKDYKAELVNDGDNGSYWASPDGIINTSIEINLGQEQEVNRILIQEYISLGQRIKEFNVEAFVDNNWEQLLKGTTIGYKVIRKFSTVRTNRIRLNIIDSKACPTISNIELFIAPGG